MSENITEKSLWSVLAKQELDPRVKDALGAVEDTVRATRAEHGALLGGLETRLNELRSDQIGVRSELGACDARVMKCDAEATSARAELQVWRTELEGWRATQTSACELLKQSQSKVVALVRKNAGNTKASLDEQAKVVSSMQDQLTPFLTGFKAKVNEACGDAVARAEGKADTVRAALEAQDSRLTALEAEVASHARAAEALDKLGAEAGASEARLVDVVDANEKLRIKQEHQARNLDLIESKLSEQMATTEHVVKTVDAITKHVGAPHLKSWKEKVAK